MEKLMCNKRTNTCMHGTDRCQLKDNSNTQRREETDGKVGFQQYL